MTLRFDGMYFTVEREDRDDFYGDKISYKWLRFFPDGAVISVSVSGETSSASVVARSVARWFCRTHPASSHGRYALEGVKLSFSTTSSAGTVEYQGRLEAGDTLELRTHSRINGHRATPTYEFIAIPEPDPCP